MCMEWRGEARMKSPPAARRPAGGKTLQTEEDLRSPGLGEQGGRAGQ